MTKTLAKPRDFFAVLYISTSYKYAGKLNDLAKHNNVLVMFVSKQILVIKLFLLTYVLPNRLISGEFVDLVDFYRDSKFRCLAKFSLVISYRTYF